MSLPWCRRSVVRACTEKHKLPYITYTTYTELLSRTYLRLWLRSFSIRHVGDRKIPRELLGAAADIFTHTELDSLRIARFGPKSQGFQLPSKCTRINCAVVSAPLQDFLSDRGKFGNVNHLSRRIVAGDEQRCDCNTAQRGPPFGENFVVFFSEQVENFSLKSGIVGRCRDDGMGERAQRENKFR